MPYVEKLGLSVRTEVGRLLIIGFISCRLQTGLVQRTKIEDLQVSGRDLMMIYQISVHFLVIFGYKCYNSRFQTNTRRSLELAVEISLHTSTMTTKTPSTSSTPRKCNAQCISDQDSAQTRAEVVVAVVNVVAFKELLAVWKSLRTPK